jgi:hypothetical protein
MKLLIALISLSFLLQACGQEKTFKKLDQDIENDSLLDSTLHLKVQYYQFDTLDLSLD